MEQLTLTSQNILKLVHGKDRKAAQVCHETAHMANYIITKSWPRQGLVTTAVRSCTK